MKPDLSAAMPLMHMLGGYYSVWVLHTAAQLDIADILKDGPRGLADIAAECAADQRSLARFLVSLEGLEVIQRTPAGEIALTPTGHWLRSDVEGSLKARALLCGEPSISRAWAACADAVRTGRPSFGDTNGRPFFEYLDEHRGALECFQEAMSGFPYVNELIVGCFDFSNRRCVMDVGGGTGILARAIVEAHPAVSAIVLDRPAVVASFCDGTTHERIGWVGGDFLKELPEGADTHVLRFVLSDWSDEDTGNILTNCRRALPDDGCLLIVENLAPEDDATVTAALDLTMLVLTGGRVRTAGEYRELLRRAGFTHRETIDTSARIQIVVADC